MINALRIFVLIFLMSGCAEDLQYRKVAPVPQPYSSKMPTAYSLEEHAYSVLDASGSYYTGYVEFDDQGWYHDPQQQVALLNWLEHERQSDPNHKFLIVVYAHGWKHNSAPTDPDVGHFQQLLQDLAVNEQALESHHHGHVARKVLGVYLGWRGASVPIPGIENTTFWWRKNAAEHVGHRSAKNLLLALNQFRAVSNQWCTADHLARPNDTQLVLIGHSFGGLVMYDALQAELTDRVARLKRDGTYHIAKSFGDFVLLVNPAFEGASYESLFQAATMRTYSDKQRPIMAIVTTSADWATHYAFPAGRMYTVTERAPHKGEREAVMDAIGHLDRYRTHTLTAVPEAINTQKSASVSDMPAPKASVHQAREDLAKTLAAAPNPARTQSEEIIRLDHGILTRYHNPNIPTNFPYLSIYTDETMMTGHNDIWNANFYTFMLDFITRQVMLHVPPSPPPANCADDNE